MCFLSIQDLSVEQIKKNLDVAGNIKKQPDVFSKKLDGKKIVLIFEKPSNRTRVSFEVGIYELGGNVIHLGGKDVGLGKREPIKDIARVLSRYVDCIIARTYSHNDLLSLKEFSSIPVINALSDLEHPCQVLSDIFTIYEKGLKLDSIKLTYLGDGNNVLNSLLLLCSKLGIDITMGIPEAYIPQAEILNAADNFASESGSKIELVSDSEAAVKNADVLYTDVWTSMGQEEEYKKRKNDFKEYQVNNKLVSLAKKDCLIMHCLPAHRGEEITDEVVESKNSIVFDQAENRLHVQKAILLSVMN